MRSKSGDVEIDESWKKFEAVKVVKSDIQPQLLTQRMLYRLRWRHEYARWHLNADSHMHLPGAL